MNIAVRRRGRLKGLAATGLLALGLLAIPASAAAATLSLSANDAAVGQTIQATAELTDSPGATGTIFFEVFAPGDPSCEGPALTPAPASKAVAGEGSYPSGTFTPSSPGAYRWSAVYLDETETPVAEADCTAISNVDKAAPSLAGIASSAVVGNAIRDEATLTGGFSPSGEVTFRVFAPADTSCGSPLRTDTAPIAAGKATAADFVPQQAGDFRWTAFYPGDANNEAASTLCNAAGQTSAVGKATPLLAGTATSAVQVGQSITDSVTVSGGFEPSGQLVFRAFGPDDPTCAKPAAYGEAVGVDGDDTYAPLGFDKPPAGLYLWSVTYEGDENNAVASLSCGVDGQRSAVGTLNVTLAASASSATVGGALTATAALGNGAIPGGQLTFKAFPPADTTCSGAAAFSSTVAVAGNGSYRSAGFSSNRVGTYRWTVAYSGDSNHAAASSACGVAASAVTKASPLIAGKVGKRLTVGTKFRDTVTLTGAYAPSGTVRFEIYGPDANGCAKPAFVNTVAVNATGVVQSDPFVAKRAGRYRFVAKYSGDAANQPAAEACGSPSQLAQVQKRTPNLRPRALLIGPQQISIRARLAGASSPTGAITFRLFAPGDRRCDGRPAFTGSLRIKANGTFSLAEYIATKPGVYRLGIAYSGDPRNRSTRFSCAGTQLIRVGSG